MSRTEWRAVGSLALIYWLRMLGLFMILPVFAAGADQYAGATPALIGMGVGVYGLTQALLQIPFGMASDRFGRKRIIAGGLLVFVVGSVLAAQAQTIEAVIVGRALQGAGAISAALTALLADLTRPESRTLSMAVLGISIGAAFLLALIAGPVLVGVLSLDGVFVAAAALGGLALLVLLVLVPAAPPPRVSSGMPLRTALTTPGLKPLYGGVFLLHAAMTGAFVVIPLVLRDSFGLAADVQWRVFAPVMVLSVLPLPLLIRWAERGGHQPRGFAASIVLAGVAMLGAAAAPGVFALAAALTAYFVGFNLLEASLPSLVSRSAPADIRGAALGVYSSAQFLGAFVGGSLGGYLMGEQGATLTLLAIAALLLSWLGFVRHTPWALPRASFAS